MGKGQIAQLDIGYMIDNYRLWKKEIARLERAIYGGSRNMSSWGVAQYGIEATMPRGSSIRSAAEMERMDIRERSQLKRLERLESYVYALEVAYDLLKDERLKTIYDCLLDGMTYRQIAEHLATSKDYVCQSKKEILRQIGQNGQIRTILTYSKNAG
ncbi:sigma-70 family RNA polymerase sigma factor [Metasolibacillus sp.]|uniref:sigma-70 family RNA polymerase sigma factor n=1 Tax=Metasolibacillus sp. TaxID=2703680 RepID=UPI0025F07EEB|nr:sigma-70 family RNA polymerase sigma factor [Metasolibacillus sp.]MCT6924076.1 sigma-70 family RNA polymerase sigma factor [Metasolibacillus sp.]MCT6940183.1 sigma-70 family RNA polymerase sigma factor [Metasolibacillus sp.]